MWLLIVGILILILASFWHSYSTVGYAASSIRAPAIFNSRRMSDAMLVHIGWFILFLIGIVILWLQNWLIGMVAILVYWFVLPLLVQPVVKRRMLPAWDELPAQTKATLEEMGYNRKNYLNSNWWRKDFGKREFSRLMKAKRKEVKNAQ